MCSNPLARLIYLGYHKYGRSLEALAKKYGLPCSYVRAITSGAVKREATERIKDRREAPGIPAKASGRQKVAPLPLATSREPLDAILV